MWTLNESVEILNPSTREEDGSAGYGHSPVSTFGTSGYGLRMNHFDPLYNSPTTTDQLSINQKIDRLTSLIEDQTKETKELKAEFNALKCEVDHHIKDVPDRKEQKEGIEKEGGLCVRCIAD